MQVLAPADRVALDAYMLTPSRCGVDADAEPMPMPSRFRCRADVELIPSRCNADTAPMPMPTPSRHRARLLHRCGAALAYGREIM